MRKRRERHGRGGRNRRSSPPHGPDGQRRAGATSAAVAGLGARRAQLRFALTFLLAAGALFAIYSFPYQENGISESWFHRYLAGYAQLAGSVLGLFDGQVHVEGTVIDGRFSLNIVKSCDAMEASLLFLAAIVAWPGAWRRKILAAAVGLVALTLLNVVRICSLYAVGIHFPRAFELLHVEIWPLLLILATIGNFIVWARWMRPGPVADAPPEAA